MSNSIITSSLKALKDSHPRARITTGRAATRAQLALELDLLDEADDSDATIELRALPRWNSDPATGQTVYPNSEWIRGPQDLARGVEWIWNHQARHIACTSVNLRRGRRRGNDETILATEVGIDIDAKLWDPDYLAGRIPESEASWLAGWGPMFARFLDLCLSDIPPSWFTISGHGIHARWILAEAADLRDTVEAKTFFDVVRGVTYLMSADPHTLKPDALLRVAGPQNRKPGKPSAETAHIQLPGPGNELPRYNLSYLADRLPVEPLAHVIDGRLVFPPHLTPQKTRQATRQDINFPREPSETALQVAERITDASIRKHRCGSAEVTATEGALVARHAPCLSCGGIGKMWFELSTGKPHCWKVGCDWNFSNDNSTYRETLLDLAKNEVPEILPILDAPRRTRWNAPKLDGVVRSTLTEASDRIKDSLNQATEGSIERKANVIIQSTMSAGKTHHLAARGADASRGTGRPVALVVANHELGTELETMIDDAGGDNSAVAHWYGVGEQSCQYWSQMKAFPVASILRANACGGCPEKEDCIAWNADPEAPVLVLTSIAYEALLKRGALNGRDVFFDEMPTFREKSIPFVRKDIRAVNSTRLLCEAQVNPALKSTVFTLQGPARSVDRVIGAALDEDKPKRYARHLRGDDLRDLMNKTLTEQETNAMKAAAMVPMRRGKDTGKNAPCMDSCGLDGGKLRSGKYTRGSFVRHDLPRLFRGICRLIGVETTNEKNPWEIELVISGTSKKRRTVKIRLHRLLDLRPPTGGALVALDGTAGYQRHIYEAGSSRPVEVHGLEVDQIEGGTEKRIHFQHHHTARRHLCHGELASPEGVRVTREAIEKSIMLWEKETGKPRAELHLVVFTHRPIIQSATKAPKGPLRQLRLRLEKDLASISFDYFGRGTRGTNAYKTAHMIIVVGNPWPNVGDMETLSGDLKRNGIEISASNLGNGNAAAELVQAFARSRSLRRAEEVFHVMVAAGPAPGWGLETASHQLFAINNTVDPSGVVARYVSESLELFGVASVSTLKKWGANGAIKIYGSGLIAPFAPHFKALQLLKSTPRRTMKDLVVSAAEMAGAVPVAVRVTGDHRQVRQVFADPDFEGEASILTQEFFDNPEVAADLHVHAKERVAELAEVDQVAAVDIPEAEVAADHQWFEPLSWKELKAV